MAAVPEPPIDHMQAGLALMGLVPRLAARGRALADLVRPDEVPADAPAYLGTYKYGFHSADAAVVRAFLAERAELVPLARAFGNLLVMRTEILEGVTAWRPELATPEAVEGWLVLENPRFPLLVCGEGGKARIASRPPTGVADLTLELPPIDPSALDTTGAITEPRAAALVDEVFCRERFFRVLDGELAPSLLFTTDDVHLGRREVIVLALRDGRIDSLGQENLRLLPERPVSERLYWDFLRATRAVLESGDHGHRLPSRILDIELLEAPSSRASKTSAASCSTKTRPRACSRREASHASSPKRPRSPIPLLSGARSRKSLTRATSPCESTNSSASRTST